MWDERKQVVCPWVSRVLLVDLQNRKTKLHRTSKTMAKLGIVVSCDFWKGHLAPLLFAAV